MHLIMRKKKRMLLSTAVCFCAIGCFDCPLLPVHGASQRTILSQENKGEVKISHRFSETTSNIRDADGVSA